VKIFSQLLFISLFFATLSCESLHHRHAKASSIAKKSGFSLERIKSGQFLLTTFKKEITNEKNLVVYIEGDGFAWKRKNIQSIDPTPKDPVALKLAVRDPRNSILYIARPCQYLSQHEIKECHPKYWSTHRYAEEVIRSINSVIDSEILNTKINSISLVGYSGGGTVAALIAARRNDVTSLTTVAANLDHVQWTTMHDITPLSGSLNAADYAIKIEHIAQLHLIGAKDKLVPRSITEAYKAKANNPEKIKIKTIPDFNHQCCWEQHWQTLLCQNNIYVQSYCSNE